MSLNSSPVKPLNFLPMKVEMGSADNLATKEFNSSSDTYTSETEVIKDHRNNLEQPGPLYGSHNGSREGDDFLFATPMTSTVNLHNQETKSAISSPGKSIMKKTPGNSPKKSVVFTSSNPEIHLYENNSLNNEDEIGEKIEVENVIESEWNELNQDSDEEVLTPAAIPPPPPPHKSSNFMSFLTMSSQNDDVNLATLQSLKSKSKNFSNLSLNEKLDMYLSNNQKEHNLDDHLNDLNNAIKSKTESNIHTLLLNLQNAPKERDDNPLESLTKDTEVQIRSAGSSQSSLQSLVHDNRLLDSVNIPILNKGTKVINGIRGIDDDIVASVIPKTNENLASEDENAGYDQNDIECTTLREPNEIVGAQSSSDDEKFHDSFNTTNTNTEKSIMNLLMSSSNDLHTTSQESRFNNSLNPTDIKIFKRPIGENVEDSNNHHGDEKIKQEDENNLSERKYKPQYNQTNANENNIIMKHEDIESVPHHNDQTIIKGELDDLNLGNINHMDYYEGMKLELVSGFGKASAGNDIKLVKTNFNGRKELIGTESENEVNRVSHEQPNENEMSEIANNSAQVSLRFHMDSDWKLEDSNDGDREDNDDYTQNELTTINHNNVKQKPEILGNEDSHVDTKSRHDSADMKSDTSSSVEYRDASDEYRDASDVTSHRSLAPPRLPINESDQRVDNNEESEILDDGIALANSSNIAPPEELTLPVIDTNNYSSFEDLTKNINISGSSFEESLSAEHDTVKAPLNYISIWHSQDSQKRKPKESKPQILNNIQALENENRLTPRILSEMNKRKFKEINVTSRRIVSPGTEDFNISAFLPELSDDSGFENHFIFLKNNASVFNYSSLSQRKETDINTKNILSNIHESKLSENCNSEAYKKQQKRRSLRPINHDNNLITKISKNKSSKFRVPSFDIQRSNSILSPKNKYDDIFEDVLKDKPTIVSEGMKTLPSMDRNDVQRILNTKKVITQDDFVNLKLGNQSKYSVIEGTYEKYDELQQHASIYNASPESTAIDDGVLPHLANELLKSPGTLLAKDQYFNESKFSNDRAAVGNNSEDSPIFENDAQKNEHIAINSYFPDPDPELVCSPVKDTHDEITEGDAGNRINPNNPFLVHPNNNSNNSEETITKYEVDSPSTPVIESDVFNDPNIASSAFNTPVNAIPLNQGTPAQKKSPIKIGSPIKLIKEGSKVTGVTTVQTPSKKIDQENLGRIELNNQKLRASPTKPQQVGRKLSTVSVPSIYTNKSSQSGKAMSNLDEVKNSSGIEQGNPDVTQTPRERGKLFFKVNGIKNIGLPDIPSHNAEFSLTLDNGVHCIKTPNYKMSKNVHIGKEFELTVGNSLEFIITLKAVYDKPGNKLVEVKERRLVKSKNRISRLFGSKDIVTTTKFVSQEVKDNWKHKFAQDGSFARCYIDLNQFEDKINCRAINFDLNCFNEWETLQTSDGKLIKNKPYRIGQLEVTMLYIPRSDEKEVLPTSIRLAYDITLETKQTINTRFEGYLHQEGGDCEVWKRRFFKLEGTSLIAHSEFSHKTRAKINLAKIIEVLYFDEENITKPSTKQRNFSDLLLVQHSFKIKFANGEVIDFSAPNKDEKLHWISLLENIIRRNRLRQQPWVNLMLSKQVTQQINY